MQNSKCLFNSATALRRVFLSGAVASDAIFLQQQAPCQFLRSAQQSTQQQRQTLSGSRPFSTQPALFRIARNSGYLAAERAQLVTKERMPRDSQIRTTFVHIIGPNGLSRPMRTSEILADLDRRHESLVMVAPAAGKEEADRLDEDGRERPQWPVCKIVDIQKERQEEYKKRKEERKKHVESKELEINWAIAPNDLEMTKLKQLRKFLAKGFKIQIKLLNSRKGRNKKTPSKEEAERVLQAIQATVAEIPGSREAKVDGEVGKTMTINLEGPSGGYKPPAPPANSTSAPSPETEAAPAEAASAEAASAS
ncbi:hypothetical protein QBC37DRAFT_409869 [Rhypophila decipiens]|uniref:Translation initiation factor 3 N-terminal domain-containing protein n=1 Tax=Rhypophila decipiens TaxID=261697 RepID=A0AAN6YMD4_9PEZI|nr:hypothetical protein QBC37DRAFT_409869 [Rhypophila decipiens]